MYCIEFVPSGDMLYQEAVSSLYSDQQLKEIFHLYLVYYWCFFTVNFCELFIMNWYIVSHENTGIQMRKLIYFPALLECYLTLTFSVNIFRFCKKCQRYVSQENRHCSKCDACTSKVRTNIPVYKISLNAHDILP